MVDKVGCRRIGQICIFANFSGKIPCVISVSIWEVKTMHNLSGNMGKCVIADLIGAIDNYLEPHQETISGVSDVLAKISSVTTKGNLSNTRLAQSSAHTDIVISAISAIRGQALEGIRHCLISSMDKLIWRRDDGEFYTADSDVGDGYRNSNLHSLLIGPSNSKYYHPDFTLGIFLLSPLTLYRDHFHQAPELYVNLSPRTGWRFQGGEWTDYFAGSLIWNESNVIHATCVYDEPFISIFSWTRDITSSCKIVRYEDWERVEKKLKDRDT